MKTLNNLIKELYLQFSNIFLYILVNYISISIDKSLNRETNLVKTHSGVMFQTNRYLTFHPWQWGNTISNPYQWDNIWCFQFLYYCYFLTKERTFVRDICLCLVHCEINASSSKILLCLVVLMVKMKRSCLEYFQFAFKALLTSFMISRIFVVISN